VQSHERLEPYKEALDELENHVFMGIENYFSTCKDHQDDISADAIFIGSHCFLDKLALFRTMLIQMKAMTAEEIDTLFLNEIKSISNSRLPEIRKKMGL
jgi:hypothetical protein